jgi:hypothetical protein
MSANLIDMSDRFVPLALPSSSSKEPGFAPLGLKVLPRGTGAPAFDALTAVSAVQARSPEACSKPTVTLQRKGEAVSGIRIQCGCGEVIELTCLH